MKLIYIKKNLNRLLIISLVLLFTMIGSANAKEIVQAEFTSTPLPRNNDSLDRPVIKSTIRLYFDDHSVKDIPLSYKELFRSGQRIGNNYAGSILDKKGNRINNWGTASNHSQIREGPIFSSSPDGNTLIQIKKQKTLNSDAIFLVTHFEKNGWVENDDKHIPPFDSEYDAPMAINLTQLSQSIKNGTLTPKILTNIRSKNVPGFWFPCASSLTPWNTHLGAEEYEPNARWFEFNPLKAMNLYLGTQGKTVKQGGANPYKYGFPIEIKLNKTGKPEVKKRYAMGRVSFELGLVMPDERTVYLSDDAKDGIRLMFIADNPRDLSSGTLYAAKWKQTMSFSGGQADLKWIKLGHSNENTITKYLDNRLTFSDIFESKFLKSGKEKFSNISSYTPIYVFHGYTPKSNSSIRNLDTFKVIKDITTIKNSKNKIYGKTKTEYLKIKKGMETAAAFLETRRFAALKGATTEFTKMEGQAINKKDKKLYTAISKAYKGMLKGENGDRLNDDISLKGNPDDLLCGLIYESELESGLKDTEGNAILSDWVAINMKALIKGKSSGAETCDENNIANPDNLKFSEKFRSLFIAEDSGTRHSRDVLWAYSVDKGNLTRILVAPKHSEVSGLFITENLNGYAYIFSNFQRSIHPEDFWKNMKPEDANQYISDKDLRGIVGYIGPIPLGTN